MSTTPAIDLPEDNILDDYNNSAIMPVNAPPAPNYSKDYLLPAPSDNLETGDADDTIEYSEAGDDAEQAEQEVHETVAEEDTSVCTQDQSPPGRFRFRHHGIRRNLGSPKTKSKKYQCIYCPLTADSKRELNQHHRSSHGIMTCVDCRKNFPTPDALQQHRYIHQTNREQFKCEICDEVSAFESDMKRHRAKLDEERMWYCDSPNCDRSFKRKSDMTSHTKTHTNEVQKCPAQGCDYSNMDPRNLKCHMKCHSNEKPLKCSMCSERFKHYQQLKRHKENHP